MTGTPVHIYTWIFGKINMFDLTHKQMPEITRFIHRAGSGEFDVRLELMVAPLSTLCLGERFTKNHEVEEL